MLTHIAAPVTAVAEGPRQSERRDGVRTPTILSLLYSGMDSGQMLIGDEERRFGVELGTLKLEEKYHLGFFLWDCVTPSGRDGGI